MAVDLSKVKGKLPLIFAVVWLFVSGLALLRLTDEEKQLAYHTPAGKINLALTFGEVAFLFLWGFRKVAWYIGLPGFLICRFSKR